MRPHTHVWEMPLPQRQHSRYVAHNVTESSLSLKIYWWEMRNPMLQTFCQFVAWAINKDYIIMDLNPLATSHLPSQVMRMVLWLKRMHHTHDGRRKMINRGRTSLTDTLRRKVSSHTSARAQAAPGCLQHPMDLRCVSLCWGVMNCICLATRPDSQSALPSQPDNC